MFLADRQRQRIIAETNSPTAGATGIFQWNNRDLTTTGALFRLPGPRVTFRAIAEVASAVPYRYRVV